MTHIENKTCKIEKSPMISVIMSTYNRENYLPVAMESILNQTYTDFEFIIIDDASTDNTAKLLQEYQEKDSRIVVISNPQNLGYNKNLTTGFKLAKGKYLARIDDDDISLPTRFEKQVDFLEKNPDITVVGTFIEIFGNNPMKSWCTLTDWDELAVAMNFYNPICHPSVMIRNSFLKEHHLAYDPEVLYAEEYDLWKNIIFLGGKLANIPEVLLKYRSHLQNVSQKKDTSKIQTDFANSIRNQLLSRMFSKTKIAELNKKLIYYPFDCNKKKILEETLNTLKKFPDILPSSGIDKLMDKLVGKKSDIHIFFASDDNYAQHLAIAITSLLINSTSFDNFHLYILDGNISEKNKNKILACKKIKDFQIEFIEIDDKLFEICPLTPDCQHISRQTYYRYIIPILKPELEKCFYFDCDIIITDSLNKLWNIDLKDNYIAAVEELYEGASDDCKRLNIEHEINAGILLINNKKWITDNIVDLLFKNTVKLAQQNILKWQDQDVINYTFNKKILFVSPAYNLQCNAFYDGQHSLYTDYEMKLAKSHYAIIHYNSNLKPWHNGCRHPLWKQYFYYLQRSPYKKTHYLKIIKLKLTTLKHFFFIKEKNKDNTELRYKILRIRVVKVIRRNNTKEISIFGFKMKFPNTPKITRL